MDIEYWGFFYNGTLMQGPITLPKVFSFPDGGTIGAFDTLTTAELNFLQWYQVNPDCIDVTIDPDYESITYSEWRVVDNTLTRDYEITPHSFEHALYIAWKKLNNFKVMKEVTGCSYDLNGVPITVMTDREVSQPKLIGAYLSATDGDWKETDTLFVKDANNNIIAIHTNNETMLDLCRTVRRFIQSVYNKEEEVMWELLGCLTTPVLKKRILDGTIKLNPWATDDVDPMDLIV